jgi:FAD/FMN-containing dehydrogenase
MSSAPETLRRNSGGDITEPGGAEYESASRTLLAPGNPARVAAIYPTETYNRLAAVRRQYDPGNLFARNHNIRPH